MSLIGLVGFAGSGKSTFAKILSEEFGYHQIAFGDALKDVVCAIFGWDRQLMTGETPEGRIWREQVDPWWATKLGIPNFSPRFAMQHIGTDVLREHFNDSLWISIVERKIAATKGNIVVTDCRFWNELKIINENGGRLVRIVRGADPAWTDIAAKANGGDPVALAAMKQLNIHRSEWASFGFHIDVSLPNDDTIEVLRMAAKSLCETS